MSHPSTISRVRSLALLTVAAAIGLTACAGTQAAQPGPGSGDQRYVAGTTGASGVFPADRRKPAPTVSGTTLDGHAVRLSDYRGKVVVVNFWASWCAPCRAEAPTLEKVSAEQQAGGVQFLGVNVKDGQAAAQAFQRTFKISYPSVYDQPGDVALAFRDTVPPQAIPSTIVIDRQGRIAAKVIGIAPYATLRQLVTTVAAEGAGHTP